MDDFIINSDVLGPGQPLRYSKELTQQNALRLDDSHLLNIRVDYRRTLGPVDLVASWDVINVYGGPDGARRNSTRGGAQLSKTKGKHCPSSA